MSEEELKINDNLAGAAPAPAADSAVSDEDATVVHLGPMPVPEKKQSAVAGSAPVLPEEIIGAQSNDLVGTASVILTIAAELRRPHVNIDLAKLRQSLSLEIEAFKVKAKNNGIAESQVTLARYALCAVLDEFVLDTPWGANSNWSEHSLLTTFHQDSAGGAKFFAILTKLQQTPSINAELLELLYICLALGFVGKYRVTQGGNDKLRSIKQTLYRQILEQRGEQNVELSPQLTTLDAEQVNTVKRVPVLRLCCIVLVCLALAFSVFRLVLNSYAGDTMKNFRSIIIENTQSTDGSRVAES
jgi:type VI secretion system protein ImpK